MAFLLGVWLVQCLPALPDGPWLAGLLLSCLFIILLHHHRRARVMAIGCFGFFWAATYGHGHLSQVLAPSLEGKEIFAEGIIGSLPDYQDGRVRFLFFPERARLGTQQVTLPSRLRLAWYQGYPATLAPGQRWALTIKLKRPWGMMNPGGFDYEGWLFARGIGATGYIRQVTGNRLLADSPWEMPLQRLRYSVYHQLQTVLGEQPAAGIITALALGERGGISREQWQVLRATGTNHLVAISGLHVGLVAGFLYLLLQWLWRRCSSCCLWLPAPRAGAVAALLSAVLYAALAGFSLPTQRALVMLAVVLGATFWQRALSPVRALLLALWAVLLWQPLAVLSAGFWLSFAAVAAILFAMGGRLQVAGLWWRWGRVQVMVGLALLPLVLLFFGQGSLSAPLANLLAVPVVGFVVVPLTLTGTLLLPVWASGADFLLHLSAELVQVGWPTLTWLSGHIPTLNTAPPAWSILPALAGLGWLLMPRGWPLRSAGLLLWLPLLLLHPSVPAVGTAEVTLLDVGQGLAAVVRTRHHSLVFDTGPRYHSGFNTGDAVVLPFLQQRGVKWLDTLIVSHGDNDHIGGARALLEGIPVARVLTSVPRKMTWVPNERCHAGQHWQWDGVNFSILNPLHVSGNARGNNDSCVLKVSTGAQAVLLPGDIEREAESELLAAHTPLTAQVLVAPHHGSKTSSSEPFLAAVNPRWVLFPVGYRNRYGFPRPAIVQRYQARGVRQLETYHSGAITLTLGDGPITPHSYRQQSQRYWYSR